ncbi:MAG: TetR family transcriptional regulator [Microbacteriaceae bacterium]|jgi:AcrR family transcriptional regulator|nr:TetR family transcriptional regulator [Microbacteriaceae bacterium]HOA86858.1 TetR family transcriptional regulator [Microbacteriaceae bacterium]HPZ34313.1 TetR family transcriptional regulator [Microbacteriaceae bacterium]HQC92325.1 TetR family transcriptional regulator [Microbacteriaceae bacterium]
MAHAGASGAGRPARRAKSDVVDAALGILEAQGLPDLTMRRIAEALGVQPSALYWHFPNKQTLLAAVSERILAPGDAAPDPALPWHEGATAVASTLRRCLLRYRDGAELVSSSLAMGLVEAPAQRQLFELAVGRGMPPALARVAASTITHFVLGHTFQAQQRLEMARVAALAVGAAETARAEPGPDDDFEGGVRLIVRGAAASAPAAEERGPQPGTRPERRAPEKR